MSHWPNVSPLWFAIAVALLVAVAIVQGIVRALSTHHRLHELAGEKRMTIASCDRFELADRLENELHVSDVHDVLHRNDGIRRQYFFTAMCGRSHLRAFVIHAEETCSQGSKPQLRFIDRQLVRGDIVEVYRGMME